MVDIAEHMADRSDLTARMPSDPAAEPAAESGSLSAMRDLTLTGGRSPARPFAANAFRGVPLHGVVQARKADGEQPVVVPRIILQAPLWCSARAARQIQGMRFEWVQPDPEQNGLPVDWVVETFNPLDHNHGDELKRTGDPFGRLQWFDQDLLFCLSLEFFRRNCQTTYIAVDQTSVLQWIGYKQVHDPPYAELRSSIRRMSWTQIAWYRKGEKEVARGIDLLSKESGWEKGTRSRPGEIVALLSDSWLKQIYDTAADRQVIDLTRYFHLVRFIRNTEGVPDLARSVYTFLASLADRESTVAKTAWLVERFAQRQVVKSTGKVHLRYSDPLHQGQLADALKALVESGICRDITIDGDKLSVAWQSAKRIAAIPSSSVARQTKFIDTDLRTGDPVLVVSHEDLPSFTGRTLDQALMELRRRALVSAAIEAEARARGWRTAHLAAVYGLAVLRHHAGETQDPGQEVAQALSGDWHDWGLARLAERDAAAHARLFGPGALFADLVDRFTAEDTPPEIISRTVAPPAHQLATRTTDETHGAPVDATRAGDAAAAYLDRLRPHVRVAMAVESAALARGWTVDEVVRLYAVALWRGRQGELTRGPGAWAAGVLKRGTGADWTKEATRRSWDMAAIERWLKSVDGPLTQPVTAPASTASTRSDRAAPPIANEPIRIPVARVAESTVAYQAAPSAGAPAEPGADRGARLAALVPALRARLQDGTLTDQGLHRDLETALATVAEAMLATAGAANAERLIVLRDRAMGLMASGDPAVREAGARLVMELGTR